MSSAAPRITAPATPGDRRGFIGLAALVFIWGSSFSLISLSLRDYTPVEVVIGRTLLGGLFLIPLVFLSRQSWRGVIQHWPWLLLVSVVNYAVPFVLVAWAQQSVSSSTTAIFMSAIPFFTLLMSRFVLREPVSVRRWTGFAIGFVGLIWLAGGEVLTQLSGDVLRLPQLGLMAACVMFALSSIIIRRMPRMPSMPATAIMLLMGATILIPFGGVGALETTVRIVSTEWMAPGPAAISLFALVFLAVFSTAIGQFMRTFTIQRYGPVFFSLVGYLVPVWATIIGVLLLDEQVSFSQLGAFGLIISGLVLAHDGGFGSRRA